MAEPVDTPTIEDLVGCRIVTSEGVTLGHVIDVTLRRETFEIAGVLYGAASWLYRLATFQALARRSRGGAKPHLIPWDAVAWCDRYTLALKPGGERAVRDFEL
jgi:sporulation protein YlmC with PRC-barrel domain